MRTLALALLLAGCGGPDAAPTWHADVAPILVAKCASCHTAGGIAPFALDTYGDAAPMAAAAASAVDAGTMPPFDAYESDDCQPPLAWKDDPRLTSAEKDTLRAWADAGAPEGDPATAAALPDVASATLAGTTQELAPTESFVASGTTDEFMCVSVDPGLVSDTWFTGLEVLPGNPTVVHHVVVFSDPAGASATWGDGYVDCFGAPAIEGAQALGVWVPGSPPVELPEGSGIAITAGTRIILQLHYHPTGPDADPDITTLRLRWSDTAPAWHALLTSIGNFATEAEGLLPDPDDRGVPEFRIPADVPDHTETERFTTATASTDFYFFSVEPHMHLIGTDMQIRWQRAAPEDGEAADECLVQSGWDFDWQRNYFYDAPTIEDLPRGRGGDTIWMQCHYDNTLANPGVQRALGDAGLDEPIPVTLGEGSLDEMCIAIVGVVYK
jgi:hypothetical protein